MPSRGMFWGNRGALLDARGELARYCNGSMWLICVLEFKGRKRVQWQPRRLTELYFLDEATGLAAGHRPCGECRYHAYQEFKRCLGAASVREIDARLHADRLLPARSRDRFAGASVRRFYTAPADSLPSGTMVEVSGEPHLVLAGALLRWTPDGYEPVPLRCQGEVTVITPRCTVEALAAGYRPVLHPTAVRSSRLGTGYVPVRCRVRCRTSRGRRGGIPGRGPSS